MLRRYKSLVIPLCVKELVRAVDNDKFHFIVHLWKEAKGDQHILIKIDVSLT